MDMKNCTICLVYGTDSRPLSKARVEVLGEEQMLLFFANYKLRSIKIRTIVDFYDGGKGVVRCLCVLAIRPNTRENRKKEPWMAECQVVKVREVFQRQKDLRIKTGIWTEFESEKGQFFPGTILNISAGGLLLSTYWVMKKGECFKFLYRFADKLCDMKAEVLRVVPSKDGGHEYGCRFVEQSLDTEAAIRKYVFNMQMEEQAERRKMLGEDQEEREDKSGYDS